MKRINFILLLLILISAEIFGQVLKGKVRDKSGEPTPNAAIYIREISLGIAADELGEFQTKINEGNYTLEVSSLGFEKKIINITVDKPVVKTDIILETKIYSLRGITVTNKEDPALQVMRKAIAKAPYHLHQIKSSVSESYLKESVKINKVPALLKNMKVGDNTGKKVKDYTNKLYLIEAQVETKYFSPDKYEVKTIAYSSAAPKEIYDDMDMDVNTNSVYKEKLHGFISPLSSTAFSYYKFKFEGIMQEGNQWINKIKITPKKTNRQLLSGWIYIAEGSWHVAHLDVEGNTLGVQEKIKVNYNEVKPSVFLPTSYDMAFDINLMGLEAYVKYYSTVQYKNVELNEVLSAQAIAALSPQTNINPELPLKNPSPKQQKAQQQLEQLATKDQLSNRDAFKMAKLMKDIAEPEDTVKRDTYEMKVVSTSIKSSVDSLAKMRDSLYWSNIRTLPLRDEEVQSYVREEKLPFAKIDSLDASGNGSVSKSGNSITISTGTGNGWGNYLLGSNISLNKKLYFNYGGLLKAVPEYNFVDGFWLGNDISFDYYPADKTKKVKLGASAYYLTARKDINWEAEAVLSYSPMRKGILKITGGSTTADFNSATGNSRLINSFASLLFARNYLKLYHKQFVDINNNVEIANGMRLTLGATYEKRSMLDNSTTFHFFGGRAMSNVPPPLSLTFLPDHDATIFSISLEYTPAHYYIKEGTTKRYVQTNNPTFLLQYRKAVPLAGDESASFDRIDAGIKQNITIDMFNKFDYYLSAGTFLSSKKLHFQDFKHFQTAQLPLTLNPLEYGFSLLSDYTNSTDKAWTQAHFTYRSQYLLVKNLPFLQNYLFDESVHLRLLWTASREYFEAGYSVGFGETGRVGIFIGGNKLRYLAAGITISLPLFKNFD
jgi:hypothetical protein